MVTVIIVNWNSGKHLKQCLKDLCRQDLMPNRIHVVDNGSTDGSIEAVEGMFNVEVHKLGTNIGFAGGNNHALEQIDTEFAVLLNPDAFPEPSWLRKLVAAAQAHPEVAAFGSRQMMHGCNGLIDGVGDAYHMSGLIWRWRHGCELDSIDKMPSDIFSSCAGAALYRTKVIKEMGGFDEDFFCYAEDIDLGFRLRLAGYRSMLVADAVVSHVGSASSGGKHSDFSVYHGHRNLVWTYVKNMPGWLFWACLPLHFFMNITVIISFVLKGQGSVILRAKRDALYGLPKMWQKRRKIQGKRSVSVYEIWRVLDKRLWPSRG